MTVPVTSCCFILCKNHLYGASTDITVQWKKHLTTDLEVDGSNLTWVNFFIEVQIFPNICKLKLPIFGYKIVKDEYWIEICSSDVSSPFCKVTDTPVAHAHKKNFTYMNS